MIEEARRLIQEGVLGKYALSICSFAQRLPQCSGENTTASTKWRVDPKVAGPSYVLGTGTIRGICPEAF